MTKLEYFEWCDFWIEDENNKEKPRVLLIGDSIARDYKWPVVELLKPRVSMNMMASSRGMDNEDYFTELFYILNPQRFQYDVIHLNNGLHANHLTAEEYKELLMKTVEFIQKNSKAALILALSTPVYRNETAYENEDNRRVIARNQKMIEVAEQFKLPVNDLYTLSYGKEELRQSDGIHYKADGSKLQAKQVVEYLTASLQ